MSRESDLEKLREHAADICKWRGHDMGWTDPFDYTNRQIGACQICGKEVQIMLNPTPNEIDVGGEAVALNCHDA